MRTTLLLFWLSCSLAAASELYDERPEGCGRYKVAGIFRKNQGFGLTLYVHEKTKSEYQLKPAPGELASFYSILDLPVSLEITITHIEGRTLKMRSPKELTPLVPDPLSPKRYSGFKKREDKDCEKQK